MWPGKAEARPAEHGLVDGAGGHRLHFPRARQAHRLLDPPDDGPARVRSRLAGGHEGGIEQRSQEDRHVGGTGRGAGTGRVDEPHVDRLRPRRPLEKHPGAR